MHRTREQKAVDGLNVHAFARLPAAVNIDESISGAKSAKLEFEMGVYAALRRRSDQYDEAWLRAQAKEWLSPRPKEADASGLGEGSSELMPIAIICCKHSGAAKLLVAAVNGMIRNADWTELALTFRQLEAWRESMHRQDAELPWWELKAKDNSVGMASFEKVDLAAREDPGGADAPIDVQDAAGIGDPHVETEIEECKPGTQPPTEELPELPAGAQVYYDGFEAYYAMGGEPSTVNGSKLPEGAPPPPAQPGVDASTGLASSAGVVRDEAENNQTAADEESEDEDSDEEPRLVVDEEEANRMRAVELRGLLADLGEDDTGGKAKLVERLVRVSKERAAEAAAKAAQQAAFEQEFGPPFNGKELPYFHNAPDSHPPGYESGWPEQYESTLTCFHSLLRPGYYRAIAHYHSMAGIDFPQPNDVTMRVLADRKVSFSGFQKIEGEGRILAGKLSWRHVYIEMQSDTLIHDVVVDGNDPVEDVFQSRFFGVRQIAPGFDFNTGRKKVVTQSGDLEIYISQESRWNGGSGEGAENTHAYLMRML